MTAMCPRFRMRPVHHQDGNPKSEMTSEVWCKIWDNFFAACLQPVLILDRYG